MVEQDNVMGGHGKKNDPPIKDRKITKASWEKPSILLRKNFKNKNFRE
jgi:hypothetical protein